MNKSRFITFEGVDGAGKSTHLNYFFEQLKDKGIPLLMTREPGGTPLGEKLREIVLHEPMHTDTEALIMFASRREHIEKVIKPALEKGTWVISDRFTDASFAYQGGGRGMPIAKLEQLETWVQGDFQPDLTLLFDVPIEVARERLNKNSAQTGVALDKFEREQGDFFNKVRNAYLARAEKHPSRFRVIRAEKTLAEVQADLQHILSTL